MGSKARSRRIARKGQKQTDPNRGAKREATRVGVDVLVWGVEDTEQSGLEHLAEVSLKGGNVGHGAFRLTIPKTPENLKYVQSKLGPEYTLGATSNNVPWRQVSYNVPEIDLKTMKPDPSKGYKEEVIEIYFSWWPGEKGYRFETYEKDCALELEGVHQEFNPRFEEYLAPEKRVSRSGLLNQFLERIITLNPSQIMSDAGATDVEKEALLRYQEKVLSEKDLESVSLLLDKLDTKIQKGLEHAELSTTEKILLQKYCPDIPCEDKVNLKSIHAKVTGLKSKIEIKDKNKLRNFVIALVDLNGPEHRKSLALNENELIFDRLLTRLEALYKQLIGAPKNDDNYKLNLVKLFFNKDENSLLKEHYTNFYSASVQDFNMDRFIDDLEIDIKPEKGGLSINGGEIRDKLGIGDYNQFNKKRKLNEVYHCIDDRAALKKLLRDVFAGKRNNFLSPTFDDIKKQIETIPELKRIFLNDQVKIMQNDQEIKILIDCIRRQLNTDEIATFWSDEDVRSVLLKQRWSKIVERHMSRGLGPSHEIHLPIDLSKLDPNRLPSDGLNPLAMIDAMAKIAKDGQEFNIIDNNCCVATSTALSCGAQDHMNRNLYFMQSEFYNAAFTPHSVMKAAIAYQKSINNLSAPLQIQDSKLLNTAAKATTKAVRNVQDERLGYVRRTANAIGVVLGGVFTAALASVNRSNSDLRSTPLLPGLAASASHRPHDSDTAQPDIKSRTKKTTSNNNRL